MNIKDIKSLAEIMEEKELSVIDILEGETKIHLERNCQSTKINALYVEPSLPPEEKLPAPPVETDAKSLDFKEFTEVKSPMVGVFYNSPSPSSEPFVKIGSKVKKGDILCIIEAMKLMNDIHAEKDGEIIDICVENGQVVEYSQVLFKIF